MKKNGKSGRSNEIKTKLACILYGRNSTGWSRIPYCRKRWEFITALQFGSRIYSYASNYENSCSKSSGGQGLGKIGEKFGVELDKVRSKKEVIDEARTLGSTVHLHHQGTFFLSEKCGIGDKAPKMQCSSFTPRWYCERWFWILCSMHRTKIVSISNDSRQNHGYHLQIAGLRWTSSGRSIRLYPGKNRRCSQIWECPDVSIRLPRHNWRKSWSSMEDPVVPLERNLYGHPLAGLLWERQFEKILLKHGWEKIPNWECLFVHREKGLLLSVYVDDIKLAGKKHNIDPMWKLLNKEVDLGEPTSFLDHVYLGCTQRQCEISKDIVDNYRTMFESRISAVRVEKLPFPHNLRFSSWSYDMAGHAKKCVERYCELANKTIQQLYKVFAPCMDDHHFKEEEMKSVGELPHGDKRLFSSVHVDDITKTGKKKNIDPCGKYSIKKLIWENQHISLIICLFWQNDYRFDMLQFDFSNWHQSAISAISRGFDVSELVQNCSAKYFPLLGIILQLELPSFFCAVDRTFNWPFAQTHDFCCSSRHVGALCVGWRLERHPVRVRWTTTRRWRSPAGIGSREGRWPPLVSRKGDFCAHVWTRARRATDRDLQSASVIAKKGECLDMHFEQSTMILQMSFSTKCAISVMSVMSAIFMRTCCFRFNFTFVMVIILSKMVLGMTPRQCDVSKEHVVDNYRTMFESRFSEGRIEKLPYPRIFVFLYGSVTWKVMPRNAWHDIVSWQTGRLNNSTKCQFNAMMTIVSKKKNGNPLEICQKFALKLFWNACIWHLFKDFHILWSVNKLARSTTKITKVCDKRLSRLISYIHRTCEYTQYRHVGNGKVQVHQKPLSSKTHFHQKKWNGRRLHTNTAHARLSGLTGLHVEHRRPKAGDAPHEGLLKVERRGFRV